MVEKKTITFRKFRNIDLVEFKDDISSSRLTQLDAEADADTLISVYNDTLKTLVDKHAPSITKQVVVRKDSDWYSAAIGAERCQLRFLERLKRRTGLAAFSEM